ncbi:MAG: hypothetical protein JW803_08020 [Endomicrobiales bacterium]|nr:hypothetical protein [Endomicrobiales bacterium]
MKRIKLGFLVLALCMTSVFAASLMEEKLNLEKTIQGNVERLVEKIIGSKEMVVLVNVELGEDSPAVAPGRKAFYSGMGMTEEEFLPGVTYTNVPFGGGATASKNVKIMRINVIITVDMKVSDALVARLKKDVQDFIGLDPLRGDAVNVQKIEFAKETFTLQEYIQTNWTKHIYWIIVIFVGTIFLFGPLRIFFDKVLKTMEMKINAETRIRGAEELGAANPVGGQITLTGGIPAVPMGGEGAGQVPSAKKAEGQEQHFSFVRDENIKNLLYLIRKETPESVAVILNYVQPTVASEVLSSLAPQVQSQVIANLSEIKLLDPEAVSKLENQIKKNIDYLSGGEDYFLSIIDHSDRETQDNIIHTLDEKNPALAEKIRRAMFVFEDIAILEKTAMQRLIREAQRRGMSLALALKNAKDEVKNKVFDAITPEAKAMLTEQINLMGDIAERRVYEEQRNFATLARELEKAGVIVIDRSKMVK